MARTLCIACEDCKERLWIGQGTETLYTAEPEVMDALRKFLFKHENHILKFQDENADDNWYDEKQGWKKIKIKH